MDYFAFIHHYLFERRVRIESDLKGLWRHERSDECRLGEEPELAFERNGTEPDDSLLEIREEEMSEYVKSRLCIACRPDMCGLWGPRHFSAYRFDPQNGLLCFDTDSYWLVERLTAAELVALDLTSLSQGIVTRNTYSRQILGIGQVR